MSIYCEIDDTIKNNKLYRLRCEHKETKDGGRKQLLENTIRLLETHKSSDDIKKDRMDSHLSLLKNVKYRKKWASLKMDLQEDRIRKYGKDNNINDDKINQLVNDLRKKKLRRKDIIYDEVNGVINEIRTIKKHERSEVRNKPKEKTKSNNSAKTKIINISKANLKLMGYDSLEQWLMNEDHIYIGRNMSYYIKGAKKSKWYNPYRVRKQGKEYRTSVKYYSMDESLRMYREYILSSEELKGSLRELRGKTLGCWCKPNRCHGDVLMKLVDECE